MRLVGEAQAEFLYSTRFLKELHLRAIDTSLKTSALKASFGQAGLIYDPRINFQNEGKPEI